MNKLAILFVFAAFFLNGWAAPDLTKISVSIFKSTFIYFDDQVLSIDLGMNESYDATYDNNFVRITAIKQLADYQTNLTVVTKSAIFAFLINYNDNPEKLYFFPEDFEAIRRFSGPSDNAFVSGQVTSPGGDSQGTGPKEINDQGNFEKYCKVVDNKKSEYPVSAYKKANVTFSIDQIYVADNKFYIKVIANNESNIDFDIDFVKFQIKNKRTIKRSSRQEVYIEPLFCYNRFSRLKANSTSQMVFVLDKFTIMKDKQFFVEIEEKKGERNLSLQVENSYVLNAVQI